MSVKDLYHEYQIQEARNVIPEGTAARLTTATILESLCTAFHKGYVGKDEWNGAAKRAREARVLSTREAQHQGAEIVGNLQESLLSDVRPIRRVLEAHTTSDFAHILSQVRERIVRRDVNPVIESELMPFATPRTFANFLPVKGIRFGSFDRLIKRLEGTSVTYATFDETEDGYSIANYELAFGYTWEMWINDDLSTPMIAMEELGKAARRTRGLILLEAIKAGLERANYGGSAGGPNIARLDAVKTAIATQTIPVKGADGKTTNRLIGHAMTDLFVSPKWDSMGKAALATEKMRDAQNNEVPNPVYQAGTLHTDRLMAEVLGDDWLAVDNLTPFIEFGVLRGYEAGPQTRTKAVDVQETIDEGTFDDHKLAVKIMDNHGAKVTNTRSAKRVAGS